MVKPDTFLLIASKLRTFANEVERYAALADTDPDSVQILAASRFAELSDLAAETASLCVMGVIAHRLQRLPRTADDVIAPALPAPPSTPF